MRWGFQNSRVRTSKISSNKSNKNVRGGKKKLSKSTFPELWESTNKASYDAGRKTAELSVILSFHISILSPANMLTMKTSSLAATKGARLGVEFLKCSLISRSRSLSPFDLSGTSLENPHS